MCRVLQKNGFRIFGLALVGLSMIVLSPRPAQASAVNTISAVQMLRDGAKRVIRISGSMQPTFQRFTMHEPFRLVLDFVEARVQDVPQYTSLGDGVVDSVSVESKGQNGTPMSRVMITFRDEVDYQITTQNNDVLIAMVGEEGLGHKDSKEIHVAQAGDDGTAAAAEEAAGDQPAVDQASETEDDLEFDDATPRAMTGVGFKFMTGTSRVIVHTNAKAQFTVRRMGDNRVVIEVQNTSIPIYNNQRFLDTHYFASPIKMITPKALDGATPTVEVEIELKNEVDFSQSQHGNQIWVDFPNS